MKNTIFSSIYAVILACGLSIVNGASTPELDENGSRQLSGLPAPGVHPRVFFTAEDLPALKDRLENTEFGKKYQKVINQTVQGVRSHWEEFAMTDFSNPTDEELVKYVTADEGRNIRWGVASLHAVLTEDDELKDIMIGAIVNYAHLLLASRERVVGGDTRGRTGLQLNKQFNIWTNDGFGVGVSWTIGASGYALSYDVLYNDMTSEQQEIVREAIAVSTKGRKSYGMGMPLGFAASNHYGYHGDLAVLLCAIEGEEGYDKETYDSIFQVLRDYWDVGFTDAGACHEDGYGANLGLRAGGRGYMALARRGYNIFETQKFRNFIDYFALEYEPFPGGMLIGGASGGPYDRLYPTSTLLIRYMYPDNVAANYIYRYMLGDDYERGFRWQGFLDYMIYGGDWKGPSSREAMLEESGLPLTVYYPVRGKQVSRSDWSEDALQFTLDARPDAFLIGHDSVDRGNFTMSALGRMWAFTGDFRLFQTSDEHSLVHIDGKAEAWKAPSVKFLWQSDDEKGSIAVADLKYAYDWQWTPPWPKVDTPAFASWEKEMSNPVKLGWPADLAPAWLPQHLFGSETGYAHTNGLRKRPYNPMEKAVRATVSVRGKHPFVVVADEFRKDGKSHKYEWYMQLPVDLEIKKQSGLDIILGEVDAEMVDGNPAPGSRCLLVRVLRADDESRRTPKEVEVKVEDYIAHVDKKRNTEVKAKRLILGVDSVEPHFRIMLLPFKVGERLPQTQYKPGELSAVWPDQSTKVYFRSDEEKGLLVKID